MPLARRARRLRRPEMTHRAPRNRAHDRPPQNFERLWFLKGCEKTIVHIADRQIWIDQACKAKWLYVRNNPVRHRLVKQPEDLPFQAVLARSVIRTNETADFQKVSFAVGHRIARLIGARSGRIRIAERRRRKAPSDVRDCFPPVHDRIILYSSDRHRSNGLCE